MYSEQVQGNKVLMSVDCMQVDCDQRYTLAIAARSPNHYHVQTGDREYFYNKAANDGWVCIEGQAFYLCPSCDNKRRVADSVTSQVTLDSFIASLKSLRPETHRVL